MNKNIKYAKIEIENADDSLRIEMQGSAEAMALAVALTMEKSSIIENVFRCAVKAFDNARADIKKEQAGTKQPASS